ncbi:MAG: histidine kinase [Acidimicrobiales bacterium]
MTTTIDVTTETVADTIAATRARRAPLDAAIAAGAVALAVAGVMAAADERLRAADWVRLGLVALWALAGWSAARRDATRGLGRVVVIGAALGAFAFLAARHGDSTTGGARDAWHGAATLSTTILMALSAHALLALPTGSLGTRTRSSSAVALYAVAVAVGAGLWLGPGALSVPAGALGWAVAIVVALPAGHRRYLAATGLDRQRLQWLGCGAATAAEIAVVLGALHVFIGWPDGTGAAAAAATGLIPIALAASTDPRLVGRIDRLLVHTVAVAGLTVVVVSVYVLVVIGLGRPPDDADRQVLGLSMAAAAIAAIGYLPARARLTDLANRLVYGERRAPDEVLRTFGTRLTRAIPMDELLLQLVESLRKTLTLTSAEVFTGRGGTLERTVSVPDRGTTTLTVGDKEAPVVARTNVSGQAWAAVWLPALLAGRERAQIRVAPITHSGELLGLIVIERPGDAEHFAEEDDRVLLELARQVGLALHNVQLDSALQASLDEVRRQAEELRASRSRIVATADAERRKIERNLHDGAQQHLVALAVNLRLVKDMLGDDPETATEMLDALAADVKETIQELRDLAHGIYPPLLLDSGLLEALRAAATRSPLDVTVEAEGLGRYPSEVEAAVYFCCLEALQNAGKHAPEAQVRLQVGVTEGVLRFAVADDGPGFDVATAQKGHGFVNMSDRIGAIGGTVQWESTPGHGATIAGTIPLSE